MTQGVRLGVELDPQGVISGAAKAKQALMGIVGPANRVRGAIARVEAGMFSLRGLLLTLGAGAIAKSFLQTAMQFEMLETRIHATNETLAETTNQLDFITDYTKTTVFQLGEVTDSFSKLESVGLDAAAIIPRVGEAVAAFGGGSFELQRVVRALQQIQSKGKLAGQEMIQIAEVGIPAQQILREELQLTSKEMENLPKLGLDAAQAIEVLTLGMQKRFAGSMAAASLTMTGIMSNIEDTWTLVQRNIMSGDTFSFFKAAAQLVLTELERMELETQQGVENSSTAMMYSLNNVATAVYVLNDGFWLLGQTLLLIVDTIRDLPNLLDKTAGAVGLAAVELSESLVNWHRKNRSPMGFNTLGEYNEATAPVDFTQAKDAMGGLIAGSDTPNVEDRLAGIRKRLDAWESPEVRAERLMEKMASQMARLSRGLPQTIEEVSDRMFELSDELNRGDISLADYNVQFEILDRQYQSFLEAAEADEKLAKLREEIHASKDATEAATAATKAFEDQQEAAARLIAATYTPLEQLENAYWALQDAVQSGAVSFDDAREALKRYDDEIEKAKTESKNLSDFAKDLGQTFQSAFEDAIFAGKGLREVLAGLAQDLAKIALRRLVTDQIFSAFGSFIGGLGPGTGASAPGGGALGADFIVPGAGPTDSSLLTMRVSPGERILAVPPGQNAPLGGFANGGSSIVVQNEFNISNSGRDSDGNNEENAREVGRMIEAEIVRVLQKQQRPGGVLSRG